MLTLKSDDAVNRHAGRMAKETGRSRSAFIRDVIITLANDETLKETVTAAILENEKAEAGQ
jgi:predicted transcriptional regulator